MAQKTNRQAELELIKKLYEMDGYFAAAFTRADIALMERNINADYDLLCSTSRDESDKIASLRKELEAAYEKSTEQSKLISGLTTERDGAIANFRATQKDNEDIANDLYEKAHEVERLKMQILRRDLQLGKDPTPEQRQSLIETLGGFED